jgi:hypothetical protein
MKEGGLSAGQKKIAAKAPPPDKIDAKDFAVLKKKKQKAEAWVFKMKKLNLEKL